MAHLAPWRNHLAKYRKAHPDLSLKEAMIAAKATYKKKGTKSSKIKPKIE